MDLLPFANLKYKKHLFCVLCLFGLAFGLFLFAQPVYEQNQQIELRIAQLEQKNEMLLRYYQMSAQENEKQKEKQLATFETQTQIEFKIKQATTLANANLTLWQQQFKQNKLQIDMHFESTYSQFLLFLEQLNSQKQTQIEQFSMSPDPFKKEQLLIQMNWNIYVF